MITFTSFERFLTIHYNITVQYYSITVQKPRMSSRAETPECLQKLHESMTQRTAAVVAAGEACAECQCTTDIEIEIKIK